MSKVTMEEFFNAFYSDPDTVIYFRSFGPSGNRNIRAHLFNGKLSDSAGDNFLEHDRVQELNEDSGIYWVVNSGGQEDVEISKFTAFFVEADVATIEEQDKALNECPILPSIRIHTKKSVHAYWLIDGDCTEEEWRDIQKRLINSFDGDKANKNPSRCMRLPFLNHVSTDKESGKNRYIEVELMEFQPDRKFTVDDMRDAFPQLAIEAKLNKPKKKKISDACDASDDENQTFSDWNSLKAELGLRVIAKGAVRRKMNGNFQLKCPLHKGESDDSLFFDPVSKNTVCMGKCKQADILRAFGLPDKPDFENKKKPDQADQLVKLMDGSEFYVSQKKEAFVTYMVNEHKENWPVDSKTFRDYLAGRYYKTYKTTAKELAIKDAISVLSASAKFDGKAYDVSVRTAEYEGAIYLDLVDEKWRVIRISSKGWEIVSDSPVRFRRNEAMNPLPEPVTGGSLDDLDEFVNVSAYDLPLVKGWLAVCLVKDIPFPLLVFTGEQNCGKSTTAKVLQELVDPNDSGLLPTPSVDQDLYLTASNRLVLAFDNISYIRDNISDLLCRISTGTSYVKRKNYTDTEEIIMQAKNPMILNGIGDIATRGDLLSRSIILHLPVLEVHISEKKFWANFKVKKPQILGALLDAVSSALSNRFDDTTIIKGIRMIIKGIRMLDFASFGTRMESDLRLEDGTFIRLCQENHHNGNLIALENEPVADRIKELMKDRDSWSGNSSELLKEIVGPSMFGNNHGLPTAAQGLSRVLDRLIPNLRLVGIEIKKGEQYRESGTGKRLIHIENLNFSSQASQASQLVSDNGELRLF